MRSFLRSLPSQSTLGFNTVMESSYVSSMVCWSCMPMGENTKGVECRTASFPPRYDCAQQLQADVIFFCLYFKLTRRYCVNCMAINNNLEPGGDKESLRNITAGVKKALYICQALNSCDILYLVGCPRTGTAYIMHQGVLPTVFWVARLGGGMGTVDVLCWMEITVRKVLTGVYV